jgi:hypothetical protein
MITVYETAKEIHELLKAEVKEKFDQEAHAIVMRVYRECGPVQFGQWPPWKCQTCRRHAETPDITHRDDCLWKSAETLLMKEGLL